MKRPILYSLPPAGSRIPASLILRSIGADRKISEDEFLQPIREFLGVKHVLYISSGRAALWLILKVLSKINSERTEVIIPAYTCPAVASAVLKAGLNPVLCDNNLEDFGLSLAGLNEKLSKNTLAVVVVHLLGYPANIAEVQEICRRRDTFVVEDAAQAFGNYLADSNGPKLGLIGDAGFFSLGRGKPISLMHGGLMVSNSAEIFAEADKAFKNLNHCEGLQNLKYGVAAAFYSIFSNPYMYWIPQQIPFLRLGETIFEPDFVTSKGVELAGTLTGQMLATFEREKNVRRANSEWYSANLGDFPWVKAAPSPNFPYLRYPLLIKDRKLRDGLLDSLMSQGTGAARFYPYPLNELPGLKEVLKDGQVYPNAKKISESLITLPVHSGLIERVQNRIRGIVSKGTDG